MKSKPARRYTCDFCGKHGYSASHMIAHEKHCTMNPQRVCRMCTVDGSVAEPTSPERLAELVALVPRSDLPEYDAKVPGYDHSIYDHSINETKWSADLRLVWDKIYNGVKECPACVLAVLRQAKAPIDAIEWWSYKDACKEFWDIFNDARDLERERY